KKGRIHGCALFVCLPFLARWPAAASAAEAVADRVAPLAPERAPRDLRPRRGLLPLPLAGAYQAQHPVHHLGGVAGGHDLPARLLLVDEAVEDAVEHVVRRQRILV